MFYVYLIKSINYSEIIYIGYSTDLEKRLKTHNAGGYVHTAKYRPWQLMMHCVFQDQKIAQEFEKYLKTQSGRAFTKKRFMTSA